MPDPPPGDDDNTDKGNGREGAEDDKKEYRAGNCNDCNRQFCLDYNLPICKKASMEDVFTTCFRKFLPLMQSSEARYLCGMRQSETRERTRQWSSYS